MIRIVPFVMVFLIGCGAMQLAEVPTEAPELVRMTPLPPIDSVIPWGGLKLLVMLHVMKDGTVGEVRMVESSGVSEWDSLALQSIRHWQFTPGRRDGVPADLWIRQPVAVKPRDATILALGELVCATKQEADSLHVLLENGADFDTLAMHSSIAPSRRQGGFLGAVNIAVYPQHVRKELQRLGQGEITPPLRVGGSYIMYRRYRNDVP
jgi:TonB family protein